MVTVIQVYTPNMSKNNNPKSECGLFQQLKTKPRLGSAERLP